MNATIMKLIVYLNITLFYIYLPTAQADVNTQAIITLIKQVRSHYSSSSVFILFPSKNATHLDSMEMLYTVHAWTRVLHREQFTTLSMTIANMRSLAKYYYNVPRPMVLIFLIELTAFYEFSRNSRFLKMSSFAWFVIFNSTPTDNIIDHCYNPQGNPFHLAFDTEMLVLCMGDKTLREWYSVDGDTTETFKLANWAVNKENPSLSSMDMLTNLSLYERRNDLKGKVLRGVSVKNSILVNVDKDKSKGYFTTVIDELQNAMNFTLDIVTEVREFGSFNKTTKRWSGGMHQVASGMADIGVSDFSMSNIRMDYVDYMIPILTTRCCLYMKQPEIFAVKWFAYFKAFNNAIWKTLFVMFIISLCTVAFIKSRVQLRNLMHVIYDEFLLILGIICQQGLIEFPRHTSLRIAYFTILLTAIVILSAYSASLICFLTARLRDLPFRSLEEFIEDGTYRILVLKGSAEYDMFFLSKDPMLVKISQFILPVDDLPTDIASGFKRICNNPKLGFYTGYNPNVEKVAAALHVPCQVSCLTMGRINSLSMILPKNSQYTMALNFHLQKLLNSGLLNRFKVRLTYHKQKNFEPVGIGSVASVLLIFVCGAVLALLLLVFEIYCNKCKELNNYVHPSH